MTGPDIKIVIAAQLIWRASANHALAAGVFAALPGAIDALASNLAALGHPRIDARLPPDRGVEERVQEIERTIGSRVPPVLALFWKTIGGVSLIDLAEYRHEAFWRAHLDLDPDFCCDGLHVDGCTEDWARSMHTDWSDHQEDGADDPFELALSPDALHKDNVSGGLPYGVAPGDGWLAPWLNFTWRGAERPRSAPPEPCDFLGYLRTTVLECAGFPGLYGRPGFEPLRQRLLEGVPLF